MKRFVLATAIRCTQRTCANALLTDAEGAGAGVLRRCAGAPARMAARAPKPADTRTGSAAPVPAVAAARREEAGAKDA